MNLNFPNLSNFEQKIYSKINRVEESSDMKSVFNLFMNKLSDEIKAPYNIATEMSSGKKEFDSTELIMSIIEAESKLKTSIRVINDLTKGIQELTRIQV